MTLAILPIPKRDRPVLARLMELYLHDFSEFDQAEIGQRGLYTYPWLKMYYIDPGRTPFLLQVDGKWAGFVLVTQHNYFLPIWDHWVIGEFFIMRKYRLQGHGEAVARQIFDRFPGPWQVGQIYENTPAIAFWRKVIGRYTGGRYEEHLLDTPNWRGPVQVFYSPPDGGPIQEAP